MARIVRADHERKTMKKILLAAVLALPFAASAAEVPPKYSTEPKFYKTYPNGFEKGMFNACLEDGFPSNFCVCTVWTFENTYAFNDLRAKSEEERLAAINGVLATCKAETGTKL